MRRTLLLLVIVLAFVGVPSAGAITGTSQQDFVHPYVGLVAFYDAAGNRLFRCSGSMISPRAMVTAGHCADPSTGAVSARVWLDQAAAGYPDSGGVSAHGIANFGFVGFTKAAETHDVGVVVLDQPVSLPRYGSLAGAGSLDALAARLGKSNVDFTASGYGLALRNPQKLVDPRERLMATEQLINLSNTITDGYNVQSTASPGDGRGGTCSGDSGGPLLYDTTDVIVAVDSFGMNANCRGTDYMYRLDRGPVLDWILAHVPAGERNLVRVVGL
jgi:secreted trypsin-like serine protease